MTNQPTPRAFGPPVLNAALNAFYEVPSTSSIGWDETAHDDMDRALRAAQAVIRANPQEHPDAP